MPVNQLLILFTSWLREGLQLLALSFHLSVLYDVRRIGLSQRGFPYHGHGPVKSVSWAGLHPEGLQTPRINPPASFGDFHWTKILFHPPAPSLPSHIPHFQTPCGATLRDRKSQYLPNRYMGTFSIYIFKVDEYGKVF